MRKYLSILILLLLYCSSLQAQNLVSGEYFFNTDPGVGNGSSFSFPASDSVSHSLSISTSSLSPGFHNLFLRVKNVQNVWSHHEGRQFYIIQPASANPIQPNLIGGEWFVDTDPGIGNATAFSFAQTDSINTILNLSTNGLSNGFHHLFIRVKNSTGKWSHYEGRTFYIIPPVTPAAIQPALTSGEWFVDTDPGIGNATSFSFSQADSVSTVINPSIGNLSPGTHYLFIRVKNLAGKWSHYEGRKFITCSDLLATPIVTGNSNICQGSTLSLSSSTVPNATQYLWHGPNNVTQNTQTLSIPNATSAAIGTYTLFAIRNGGTGCDTSFTTVDVQVFPNFTGTNDVTICHGETYEIGTNTYNSSGTYTDVLSSIHSCDSTVTTHLTVLPAIVSSNPQTVCFGETYMINSNVYNASGIYTDIFVSTEGCDSTVITNLEVLPAILFNNPQTICSGENYTIGTSTYSTAGTYNDILQAANGCDSSVTTIITVAPIFSVNNSQTICAGENYTIGSNSYTLAGTYTDILQSNNGCDSTVTTVLTVLSTSASNNPQTICNGETYNIGGNTYNATGVYTDVLHNQNGCDSTVTTVLTLLPEITQNNPQTICNGESYQIDGHTYATAGTYTDVFVTNNGCDSSVVTILTVLPVFSTNNLQAICVGESYSIGTNTYSAVGTYTDVLQASNGCDSTVITILSIIDIQLDLSIVKAGANLTVAQTNATYQWINCDLGNSIIPNATAQNYTAASNGNYAVVVSKCGITDTSNCIDISSLSIENAELNLQVNAFPNPVLEMLTITASETELEHIQITDLSGKKIISTRPTGTLAEINLKTLSVGVYLIEIKTTKGTVVKQIVKE